jgi:hypothetical protein
MGKLLPCSALTYLESLNLLIIFGSFLLFLLLFFVIYSSKTNECRSVWQLLGLMNACPAVHAL